MKIKRWAIPSKFLVNRRKNNKIIIKTNLKLVLLGTIVTKTNKSNQLKDQSCRSKIKIWWMKFHSTMTSTIKLITTVSPIHKTAIKVLVQRLYKMVKCGSNTTHPDSFKFKKFMQLINISIRKECCMLLSLMQIKNIVSNRSNILSNRLFRTSNTFNHSLKI